MLLMAQPVVGYVDTSFLTRLQPEILRSAGSEKYRTGIAPVKLSGLCRRGMRMDEVE